MSWSWYADVGNCTVHWAAWAQDRWQGSGRLAVDLLERPDWQGTLLAALEDVGLEAADCEQAVLCVSSPRQQANIEQFARQSLGSSSLVARADFPVEVATDYYDPAQIGADRLLNVLGAMVKVGKPCVVIDFGSCVTCDAVTAEGVLTAGAIAAGLPVVQAGLHSAVPHLSKQLNEAVQLVRSASVPAGRATAEGLALGILAGIAGTADRLIEIMRHRLRAPAPVVATGGDAELFAAHCAVAMVTDEMLTLDGLRLAYERAIGQ